MDLPVARPRCSSSTFCPASGSTVGTLGDIPTILSARWVLIDDGRRLLFLDNYGGAWDSYLNEFIDMTAVKGLNAIWTNTFVEGASRRALQLPRNAGSISGRGAQAEQPFKAYVRESQIETIAWYSGYPTLSVVNINTSTASFDNRLSKPLAPAESTPSFKTFEWEHHGQDGKGRMGGCAR